MCHVQEVVWAGRDCQSNGSTQDGTLRLTGMPQGRVGNPLKTLLRLLGTGLIGLLATGAAIWGGLALWFALPGVDGTKITKFILDK